MEHLIEQALAQNTADSRIVAADVRRRIFCNKSSSASSRRRLRRLGRLNPPCAQNGRKIFMLNRPHVGCI